jgi:hypothetical protein
MSLASQIKVIMFANTQAFTKDVRTPDGWRVAVTINTQHIKVTHTRKEVSMLSGASHFEFQWKITVTLDFALTTILKIATKTKNFTSDPNMNQQFAEKLRGILASMNLVYQPSELHK